MHYNLAKKTPFGYKSKNIALLANNILKILNDRLANLSTSFNLFEEISFL